jgi:ArsR family transcriptional regulator
MLIISVKKQLFYWLTGQLNSSIFQKKNIGAKMKLFIKVMKALSDPNRVRIVKLLQHKMMCVCELQGALSISQPTVSKHLKVLEEADLVGYEKEGLWVNYYLTDGRDNPYAASVLGNLRHWLNDEPSINELTNKLPLFDRFEICAKS